MSINSPNQLKDWLRNKERQLGIPANTLIHTYMMERLLERIAASPFRDQFIIKGGFLIASMIGIDLRSTLDMDTTIKGVPVSESTVREMLGEILAIDLGDHVQFVLEDVRNIHEEGPYEDFRLLLEARFFTVRVMLKIDITTGDVITPREIDYDFPMMFEKRSIRIKAYNLQTILAEKIESILARNITNTRARDYYDIFILRKTKGAEINLQHLRDALLAKTKERRTEQYLVHHDVYLQQIRSSPELQEIWKAYQRQYAYAKGIEFDDIVQEIGNLLASMNNQEL